MFGICLYGRMPEKPFQIFGIVSKYLMHSWYSTLPRISTLFCGEIQSSAHPTMFSFYFCSIQPWNFLDTVPWLPAFFLHFSADKPRPGSLFSGSFTAVWSAAPHFICCGFNRETFSCPPKEALDFGHWYWFSIKNFNSKNWSFWYENHMRRDTVILFPK